MFAKNAIASQTQIIGGTIPAAVNWASASASRVAIAIHGDSIGIGAYAGGTTEAAWLANGWQTQIKTALQTKYGNGGIGFINLGRGAWVKTGVWTQQTNRGPFGQCWYASNDTTKLWTLTVTEGDNADIHYLNGTGAAAFDVVVDGTTTHTITPAGTIDSSHKKANISLGANGPHTIVVKAPASGTLWLVGAAVYVGTTGVVVHNICRSGAACEVQLADRLGFLPLLGTVFNFVGYVANDYTTQIAAATYQTRINALATFLNNLGKVGFWIPPDNGSAPKAIPLSTYESYTKAAAATVGAYWFDCHKAWQTYAQRTGLMYDTMHPNTAGHAVLATYMKHVFNMIGAGI